MVVLVHEQIDALSNHKQDDDLETFNKLAEQRVHLQEQVDKLQQGITQYLQGRGLSGIEEVEGYSTEYAPLLDQSKECVEELMEGQKHIVEVLNKNFSDLGNQIKQLGKHKDALGPYHGYSQDSVALYFDEKK